MTDSLLIPSSTAEQSFQNLISNGIIVTNAPDVSEFETGKYSVRLIGKPATPLSEIRAITTGPFCVDKEYYKHCLNVVQELEEPDTSLSIMLGFAKLEYDKTGDIGGKGRQKPYSFRASDDEAIIQLANFTSLFDLRNPKEYKDYVWIFPKDDIVYKLNIEESNPISMYRLWDVLVYIGNENFVPKTAYDYKYEYSYIPDHVFEWTRYLPSKIFFVILEIYSSENIRRKFNSSADLYTFIEFLLSKYNESDNENYTPDRDLLLLELFKYNKMVYPIGIQ